MEESFSTERKSWGVIDKCTKLDCDISFVGCKFVSSHHCNLSRDSDGKVWLEDFSTNGSEINGKRITKNEKFQLNHKDCIQIVDGKDHLQSGIEFVFYDCKLAKADQTFLHNTQESSNDTEEDVSDEGENIKTSKRPHSEAGDTDNGPDPKKRHKEEEKKPEVVVHNSFAENLLCSICHDIFHDCVSLQPCNHQYCAACYSQWSDHSSVCPSCRERVQRVRKNHVINGVVEAFLKEHPEKRRSEEELREMDSRNKIAEEMESAWLERCSIL